MNMSTIEQCLLQLRNEEVPIEKTFEGLLYHIAIRLFIDYDIGMVYKEEDLKMLDEQLDVGELIAQPDLLYQLYDKYIGYSHRTMPDLSSYLQDARKAPLRFPQPLFVTNIEVNKLIGIPDSMMIYSIADDIIKYRIDVINIHVFKLPVFILYVGNRKKNEVDWSITSANWEFANKWVPVNTRYLKR